MHYDIVLVTRNRRSVLEVSIPLMLSQSRQPANFIIVDSSDDHPAVVQTINEVFARARSTVPLTVIRSDPGMTYQRNIGLGRATSEIVFFPDDDSLWYPLYAESIMRIYERDSDRVIGAIMGDEAKTPPASNDTGEPTPYKMESRDKMRLLIKPFRKYGFLTFTKDPVFLEGRSKLASKPKPAWLAEENAEAFGPMTGFAMSFRREIITAHKFDEKLGRYALFEDYDASLRVMEERLVVKAKRARVFHFRSPEKRTRGYEWGVLHILQRAYVVCKSSRPDARSRRNILPFSLYKCARYLLQCHTAYGRQRFRGSLSAVRNVRALTKSKPEDLTRVFLEMRDKCFAKTSRN